MDRGETGWIVMDRDRTGGAPDHFKRGVPGQNGVSQEEAQFRGESGRVRSANGVFRGAAGMTRGAAVAATVFAGASRYQSGGFRNHFLNVI